MLKLHGFKLDDYPLFVNILVRMLTGVVSILFYIVILAWSLAAFFVMVALYLLTVLFDRERVVLHWVSRLWARSLFWLNPPWEVRVIGRENVDRRKAYVVTVNHQSFLDIPLMYALPYLNFKWVAKTWVYRWPLFGEVMWLHGDITVSEKGSVGKTKKMMDEGRKRLRNGTSIIIFPEGTRSANGEIGNFKEGAFTLAREAGVPVLPCVINGARGFMKGWRFRKALFEVSILPEIPAATVAALAPREVMRMDRELSVAELARLRDES